MSQEAISAICSSIFDGSISSRRALAQKVINKMVIVYYIYLMASSLVSFSMCESMFRYSIPSFEQSLKIFMIAFLSLA